MKLPKRLEKIAALIPPDVSVIDVGTDHGLLPVWLALGGERRITATDIRPGPLGRAVSAAESAGVEQKIQFLLCDGLEGCESADVVVIAGMGGETIAGILERASWTCEAGRLLLLQPMSKAEALRRRLYQGGYHIEGEVLVKNSGVIYPILSVTGGSAEIPSLAELYLGVNAAKDELYSEYLAETIKKTERRLRGLENSAKPSDLPRLAEMRRLYEEIRHGE